MSFFLLNGTYIDLKWSIGFFNFLIVLKSHLDTEKYIYTCNGRLHTFNIQWSEIYECL